MDAHRTRFTAKVLPVFVEGVLRGVSVDEHGVVPLRHAQQDEDSVPVFAHAQFAGMVGLIGGLVDVVEAGFRESSTRVQYTPQLWRWKMSAARAPNSRHSS